jgi:hypothetical protein
MADPLTIKAAVNEYYLGVETDDLDRALAVFHPDARFTHVWSQQHPEKQELNGVGEIRAWLEKVGPYANSRGLVHSISDFVLNGDRGAFLAEVSSDQHDRRGQFMVWFELADDRLIRYDMRPLS